MVYRFKDIANTTLPLQVILNVRYLGRFIIIQVMYIQNVITNETLVYDSEEKARKDLNKFYSEWKETLETTKEQEKVMGFTQEVPATHLETPEEYEYD